MKQTVFGLFEGCPRKFAPLCLPEDYDKVVKVPHHTLDDVAL